MSDRLASLHKTVLALVLSTVGAGVQAVPFLSDPAATVVSSAGTATLTKDLSGYGAYSSTGVDILYSGDAGSWSFDIAGAGLAIGDYSSATVTASLVLDDHGSVDTAIYSLSIDLNGTNEFSGLTDTIPLAHGSPFASDFTNWTSLTRSASSLADPFVVSITNTTASGGAGNWIAIDYLVLTLNADSSDVPEPPVALLLAAALLGLGAARKRRLN